MSGKKSGKSSFLPKNIVGTLIVLLLAAYFIFMFISLKNKKTINFYEVEQGTLVKEHSYDGIIIRNEKVQRATTDGYINFFVGDTRKVAMNNRVYCIDESGDLKNYLSAHSEELNALSSEKIHSVRNRVMNASKSFDPVNFKTTYLLKENLDAAVLEFTDTDVLSQISDELRVAGVDFIEYRTDTTGIVSYNIDGYEELEKSDLKADLFDRTKYERTRTKSGQLVSKDDPIYKLITDETWQIVFPMEEEDISEFANKSELKINFKESGIEALADFDMFKNLEGDTFGELTLKRYLIQYISDRFIEFEIETNDVSGLKIPEKSITTKDFYLIPKSLKKQDSRGNTGVYKETLQSGGTGYTFIVAEIYAEDDDYCYVNLPNSGELKEGDFVGDPENPGERYQLGAVKPLSGVYNINKGYAVFKRIEELERANGYCIIKKNTSYGLSVYDHIILDAETIEEGQVLY